MSASNNAPVIIKRKKIVGGDGHHGGAWKVAYADFVTAMMAFFMLMWLLNATTEKQRKGIADYFNPTIPINRISGGGEGAFGGDSIFSEETLSQSGTGATNRHATQQRQARGDNWPGDSQDAQGDAGLQQVMQSLNTSGGESMLLDNSLRQIMTRLTDEGLIVELFDLPGRPLFMDEGDQPSAALIDIVAVIADVFALVQNPVAIEGYIRAQPVVVDRDDSWELSMRRADSIRMMVERAGLAEGRVVRVTGHAARNPVVADPMAQRNNRVQLILLRSDGGGK